MSEIWEKGSHGPSDFSGILNADGLWPAQRDRLQELMLVYSDVMADNSKRRAYYDGNMTVKGIGIDTMPKTVRTDEACNWPHKAVSSVAERSVFKAFRFEDGSEDANLVAIARDNAIADAYDRHKSSELIHGCMAATVGKHAGRVIVRFHSAENCAMDWDEGADRIGAGFVVAASRRTPWSGNRKVPVRVNLHEPGLVTLLRRLDSGHWVCDGTERTALDRPMMEAFTFDANGDKPLGQSRVSKDVIRLTDACVRVMRDMAVSAEFYAHPQKYLLGLTEDNFNEFKKDKWSTYIGALVLAVGDEDHGAPTFGQLAAASPQPYIDLIRCYATMFSGATGVPLNSLGIVQDNPSSAEAIGASREDICNIAAAMNRSNRKRLERVALMAMAVAENKGTDQLSESQKGVVAKFADPMIYSPAQRADAGTKWAHDVEGFAGTEVYWEMQGADPADIRRIRSETDRKAARSVLDSLMSVDIPKASDG